MKRVVLVSGHYFESRRKAGFHWLAEAYWRDGWDVTFVTTSLSWLSRLRRDYRLEYPVLNEANRMKPVRERLNSYVLYSALHPANLRLPVLNRLSSPLLRRYGAVPLGELEPAIRAADLIIFESTPGLLLRKRFGRLNGSARYVYRVSDDLRLLKSHPVVIEAERDLMDDFDLISVPADSMRSLFPGSARVAVQSHGLDTATFDRPHPSPYLPGAGPDFVFVGNSHFDYGFIAEAPLLWPEATFHVIGPIPDLPPYSNVVAYGELPFEATVPFVQHADAGLQIRAYSEGAESLTDSLKVLQYSYCGLGIVAPDFLRSARENLFTYDPAEPRTMLTAMQAAVACTASGFKPSNVLSWTDLAQRLAA